MTGGTERSAVGTKISAAKRGRASRAELGITLVAAAALAGMDKRTLRKLVERGVFRATEIREGRGIGYRFDPDQFNEDLANYRSSAPTCSGFCETPEGGWVQCDKPALPGGRCADHAANVKHPSERRACEVCDADLGVIPGSRLLDGRGHYCSHKCRREALKARHEQDPERLRNLNPEGAREHHAQVAADIEAKGKLDRTSAQRSPENKYRYSASHMCAHGPGELRVIDGSARRVYDPAELEAWEPPWADQAERRASVAYGTHGKPAAGRLAPLVAEQRRDKIHELAAQGLSKGDIAQIVGIERWRVQRALDRGDGEAAVGQRRQMSTAEKSKIRELSGRGLGRRAIARIVGVSPDQVQRLLTG